MGQRVHRDEAEKPGVPFNRMERAKNRRERLGIIGLLVEREQSRFDLLKMVDRLGIELPEKLAILLEI
jgi:hypothetical protein